MDRFYSNFTLLRMIKLTVLHQYIYLRLSIRCYSPVVCCCADNFCNRSFIYRMRLIINKSMVVLPQECI